VCSQINGGSFKKANAEALTPFIASKTRSPDLSLGQVNLLVSLGRSVAQRNAEFAVFIAWAIQHFWSRSPYHLRLALADAAGWCWDVPDEQRLALIDALEPRFDNNDPFVNTPIFESLQRLGGSAAMELEHEGVVRAQLERLLAGTNDKDAWAEGYGLYNCQFDHRMRIARCSITFRMNNAASFH
jgi:hypothetical protein